MVGPGRPRRRRASNSTAGGNDRIRYSKESTVLKPMPAETHENDLPIFVLKEAAIYRSDGRTLGNPLMAYIEGPYVIRGILEVDDPKLFTHLVRQNQKTAYIEVEGCTNYSIGDGPVTLWVSGKAGWYEIRPSAEYQPVYDEAIEAINLYYGILVAYDNHAKTRKRKKGKKPDPPTMDELFFEYALRVGNGIVRDEVEDLCHKWAEWMIAHFPREVDLDWSNTQFAKWLQESHPDLVKRVDDAARGLIPPAPLPEYPSSPEPELQHSRRNRSTKSRSAFSDSSDVEMKHLTPSQSRALPTRPLQPGKAKVETPVPIPEKYRNWAGKTTSRATSGSPAPHAASNSSFAAFDSPIDHIASAIDEIAQEMDIKSATVAKINNGVYFKCTIKTYHAAKEVVSFFAKDLLPRLGPEWNGTAWRNWLAETAASPPTAFEHIAVEDIPAQAFRRNKSARTAPKSTSVSQLPPVINLEPRTRKSGFGARNGHDSADDSLPGNHTQSSIRNRSAGKRATLRLAASKKRPAHDDLDMETGSSRGRKSSKRFHHHISNEDEDMDGDDAASSDDSDSEDMTLEEENQADIHTNPVETQLPAPEGSSRIVVVAERLPTISPTGPSGTWVCDREDCEFIVRAADEPAGQELIRQHFEEHEAQAAKIDLAMKESRGQLPIKNLLEKIQGIGEQALRRKRGTLNDKALPAPIKRRVII
ncbi:hypothetical protein QBC42DRAFT_36679 [Cladorrhinum samala]|uniref:DNA (cytosine-5)-methyltransferase 1 replication foci domain-containing protein n=1 Tax=Cladorrhinum samala TaxID=585594 RepID=A0AAV9I0K2_9PEZI|nr:hypothetical protein QBC42DRAFT_36679 [Cladorrhinum samala]